MINIKVCVAELDNGHQLRAVTERPCAGAGGFRVGDRVQLEVCPGDMARARIVRKIGPSAPGASGPAAGGVGGRLP